MKTIGYSEVGEGGTLTFPADQRLEPDRRTISLLAAELLIAKTELKNWQHSLPISHFPLASHPPPPQPHPQALIPLTHARTTVAAFIPGQSDSVRHHQPENHFSLGFPTAEFEQPPDNRGHFATTSHILQYQREQWREEGVGGRQGVREMEARNNLDIADEVEDQGTYLQPSEPWGVEGGEGEGGGGEEDGGGRGGGGEADNIEKMKAIIESMKKNTARPGTMSAPLAVLPGAKASHGATRPYAPPSLQPTQTQHPPIAKKRTKFLKPAVGVASSQSTITAIPENEPPSDPLPTRKPVPRVPRSVTSQVAYVAPSSPRQFHQPVPSPPASSSQVPPQKWSESVCLSVCLPFQQHGNYSMAQRSAYAFIRCVMCVTHLMKA